MDLLRDPIWQFFGVVLALLSLIISFIPLFRAEGGSPGERIALIQPDRGLGCGGYGLLLLFWWASAYFLYLLLIRVFFLGRSIDQTFLFYSLLGAIFFVIFCLAMSKHSQVALVITAHFCCLFLILCLIFLAFKMGAFVFKDFTSVEQWIEHNGFQMNNSYSHYLKIVPVDVKVNDPSDAKVMFIWSYIASFIFVIFVYGLSRRAAHQRTLAGEHLSSRARRRALEELEIQEKRLTITLKKRKDNEKSLYLDKLKVEVEKTQAEQTLDLATKIVDSFNVGLNPVIRAEMVKDAVSILTQSQKTNGAEKLLEYLKETGYGNKQRVP